MGTNSYIFLDRRFETDQMRLAKILNYFAQTGYNYQILLYPEGTDKCPLATERSRKYAEKNNLKHFEYVLQPRTTGFVHIIQNMRKAKYIDYVYDVTIGFGDCIVQSEIDFAKNGVCPKDVYYQVCKLDVDTLPTGDKELAKWLMNLWHEKEEKLRRFYALPPEERHFENTPNGKDYEVNPSTFRVRMYIISFWALTTMIWLYGLFMIPYMRMFAIMSCAIFGFMQYRWGGVEWLTIQTFEQSKAADSAH
ncbi:hypothetical protein Q1695_004041 [Nippostrongylus brasiliensis]|nr:hypothetical protein Q1695_004041 [Nippostrongylus brasiliensis]